MKFSIIVAVFLYSCVLSAQNLDSIVAIVNDDIVLQSELEKGVKDATEALKAQNVAIPNFATMRAQVLENLILENIQLQLAKQYGVYVDDEAINKSIEELAFNNRMSIERFLAEVQKDKISIKELRDHIRRELLISRLRQGVIHSRLNITRDEVANFINLYKDDVQIETEYRIAFLTVNISPHSSEEEFYMAAEKAYNLYGRIKDKESFSSLAVAYSEDEYALNGGDVGFRKVSQIPDAIYKMLRSMKVGDVTEPVRTPTSFVIMKLIEQRGGNSPFKQKEINSRHILVKNNSVGTIDLSEEKIRDIYSKINQGEDFAYLARLYSDDSGSAKEGGNLGWSDTVDFVPEFRRELNALKILEISKPFKTQFGWHIVQNLGVQYNDVSDKIKERRALSILQEQKFAEELKIWLQEIREQAFIEIK